MRHLRLRFQLVATRSSRRHRLIKAPSAALVESLSMIGYWHLRTDFAPLGGDGDNSK
jgi:hypothetical protein